MEDAAESRPLAGRRVLVVGASTGIGRALAVAAISAGASVGLVARRKALLRQLQATLGRAAVALPCDVRSAIAVDSMMAMAEQQLGSIDTVVYTVGVNHLSLLADTGADVWRALLETNVVGAALVTKAVLPVLRRSGRPGRVAYLSSHSVPKPWPGLGAYAASKAALESMVASWRIEEPDVAFTRVVVGPTMTGMADAWDPAVAATMFERWSADGFLGEHEPVAPEVVADALVAWMIRVEPETDLSMV